MSTARSKLVALGLAFVLAWATSCASATRIDAGGDVRVTAEFVGECELRPGTLEEAIAGDFENLERRSSPRSAADDAAYSLVERLREEGFAEARVNYEIVSSDARSLRVRFTIEQGPRTRVADVRFPGATRFERRELLTAIGMRDPSIGEPHWYVQREFDTAVGALEAFYVSRGYARVSVAPAQVEVDATRTEARVALAVVEGPLYKLVEPPKRVGGDAQLEQELDWSSLVGRPFTPRTVQQARSMTGELYERSGYPDARVEPGAVELSEGGVAGFELVVQPGVRTTLGAVRVIGADRSRASRVRSFLELDTGDIYDVTKLRESFRRLFATGLFTRVQMRLEPEGAEVRDLVIEVEEAPSRELYLEPGLGSYEGPRVLAGWRDINIFGSGRVLGVEGLAADKAQRVLASLTEPRLFDYDVQASLSVFREVRNEPSFDKDERGAALSFLRDITRDARAQFEYRYRRSELSNVDITDPLAQDELANVNISSLLVALSWDSRDSVFSPTNGVQARISVEFASPALGSELSFVRGRLTEAAFVPLSDDATLGLSYRSGLIAPLSNTDAIPLQERFYNGGENTVRSFREDRLGPIDSTGEPLGGEAFHLVSVELRQRLHGPLYGALFFDTGNIEESADDFLRFSGFRDAVGAGLRYALPIGPLRLDGAANPAPRPGEPDWVVHFSLGMSF